MKYKVSIEKKYLYIWKANRENPILEFSVSEKGITLIDGDVKIKQDFYSREEIKNLKYELELMK